MYTPLGGSKRSATGHHTLLPASEERVNVVIPLVPTRSLISWTFGRGTVIYRIWPAVILHTLFAAAVVSISLKTKYDLSIPSVMLTVLGVVIGFVISYRASSGYDRYWMGRSGWCDVTRTARTIGRLIWFHVPPRFGPKIAGTETSEDEIVAVMTEKKLALDLIEAFVVALKHHLRGEMGIYYEDLYHLVHQSHDHHQSHSRHHNKPGSSSHPNIPLSSSTSTSLLSPSQSRDTDPYIPPINAYGTFDPSSTSATLVRRSSIQSFNSSQSDEHTLLPSSAPTKSSLISHVSADLIPFESFFRAAGRWLKRIFGLRGDDSPPLTHFKHRPRVAGGGQNLPLEIVRSLSEWMSVLEDRQSVPGSSMGSLCGCLASMEDSISVLEKILTTPLPFVFSVHISTVWIYLFFLPFQLVDQFAWYTIPGVAVAAFIYLGFLAVGDEIEQPFGYDENDLDLDLFCQEIVSADIAYLKKMPCFNAHLPTPSKGLMSIVSISRKTHTEVE
ncbi:Bestrophin, RFP-TM, chloride channel-domain-containing protein [Hygrophoropsis aurantiaca]|uniref:Bestrophin, RFP-TM, chloride channel-domain-containing protein n=1 Tax=Hygrophoropsis aurantiaca TaxID=72124 RepID=A0ACB8A5G4_9AGAM|nr:Bestrophin, RFP-TM, chloride channel-domain-containing protein [Hygrophoropsis aurantiaca]